MKLILTVPANAKFSTLVEHPVVEGVRLNTTQPLSEPLEQVLENIKAQLDKKNLWIDLKCRQLRITDYNIKILNDREIHYIDLSHKIMVKTPAELIIDDGNYTGVVEKVENGNRLVVYSSVEKKQGLPIVLPGEIGIRPSMSVSILDDSLEIDGYLTDKDKEYIEAGKKVGIHNYMISFAEKESDIIDLLDLDPDARIMAKIESNKGLTFVKDIYPKYKEKVTLMAARGDLYVEVTKPDLIIDSCEQIIKADPNAVFASRLFESLKDLDKMPKCQDLFDVYCGMKMGYSRYLMGDDVCRRKDSVVAAINLFDIIAGKYKKEDKKHRPFWDILK